MHPTEMQRLVLERYRVHSRLSTSQSSLHRAMAVQYHNLKLDLKERDRLYKLDTGAEVQLSAKEMSRRAAARAGLQLPELG